MILRFFCRPLANGVPGPLLAEASIPSDSLEFPDTSFVGSLTFFHPDTTLHAEHFEHWNRWLDYFHREQEQQQKEAEESERQSQIQQQQEQDEKLQQQADEAEQNAQEQDQQRKEVEESERQSQQLEGMGLENRTNESASLDETSRSGSQEDAPDRVSSREDKMSRFHEEEPSSREGSASDGYPLAFHQVEALARTGECCQLEHGRLADPPCSEFWADHADTLNPNFTDFRQTNRTEIWGANFVEQYRIQEAMEYIPKIPNLPEVCEFLVEAVSNYRNPDGSIDTGIQGIANTAMNQIFLNRTNLSVQENLVANQPPPKYRQGISSFEQRNEAINNARSADDKLWRETIWHEIAHIHDAYLGFSGFSLSEMVTPFGAPPWPTEHAERLKTPKEDLAESYSELLNLRRNNHLAGLGEEEFLAEALAHDNPLATKYQFILENYWSYKL